MLYCLISVQTLKSLKTLQNLICAIPYNTIKLVESTETGLELIQGHLRPWPLMPQKWP